MTRERYVLGIDTSSRLGSIALAVDGAALQWEPLSPGEHSSGISRAGESLLRARGIGWKDLAGVAVSEGPGSFTGLRIGLAWAKGICFGLGIRLALVSAHEAAAYRYRGEDGYIVTVLPGERDGAQAALWAGGSTLELLWGPESAHETELSISILTAATHRNLYREQAGQTVLARPLLVMSRDVKPEVARFFSEGGYRMARSEPALSPAGAVAERGDAKLLAGETADLATSSPAYGRAPNARKPAS